MVMEKLSMTTFVVFLDDGKMTSTLAEFLLQLQGGLSQGSTSRVLCAKRERHINNNNLIIII